jgi:hypothetical protein
VRWGGLEPPRLAAHAPQLCDRAAEFCATQFMTSLNHETGEGVGYVCSLGK